MSDLRPYVCTDEECNQPDQQFSTINDYLTHETVNHELLCTVEGCNQSNEKFCTIKRYLWHIIENHGLFCPVEDCHQSDTQFFDVTRFLRHLLENHLGQWIYERTIDQLIQFMKEASIKCPFCGQQTAVGTGKDSRAGHVGRHMEEIAFLVVPKVYEDWDFYSDSLSATDYLSRS